MLATIRKAFLLTLLLVLIGFLLYRGFQWRLARDELPEGSVIAGLDVSGLTVQQAAEEVKENGDHPPYGQGDEPAAFFNPAGMVCRHGVSFPRYLDFVHPWTQFCFSGSTHADPATILQALSLSRRSLKYA